MEGSKLDVNFMAYINDANCDRISNGQWLVYKDGKAIAAGSKESMESLRRTYENKKEIMIVQADLTIAKSQPLRELEKILRENL